VLDDDENREDVTNSDFQLLPDAVRFHVSNDKPFHRPQEFRICILTVCVASNCHFRDLLSQISFPPENRLHPGNML
jgi:hypothetical protein